MSRVFTKFKEKNIELGADACAILTIFKRDWDVGANLNFEQLVGQYESSSGNTYPGDLKAATIFRCSPQRIREYLRLSLKENNFGP